MAYTGKAAFNVSGDTFHQKLGMNQENLMGGMSESSKATKRCNYMQVQVIIIDEISLAGARMLHAIHKRCTEIFGTCPEVPFGGKHVLFVGRRFVLASPGIGRLLFPKTPRTCPQCFAIASHRYAILLA